MTKKYFYLIIFTAAILACSLGSGGSAIGEVSFEGSTPTPSPPTELPIVEDIEKVQQETPQPETTQAAGGDSTIITATATALPAGDGPSLATSNLDEDDEGSASSAGDALRLDTATVTPAPTQTPSPTATDTPTPTPSATLTPVPVAVSSGWPPILPDATDINSGDRFVAYRTGSSAATVADFYRREMPGYGWAEYDFNALDLEALELAAAQGAIDPSTLALVLGADQSNLVFSKDGGDTLAFVMISETGGQVGIVLA